MARIQCPLAMSIPRVSANGAYEEISGSSAHTNSTTARGHKSSLRKKTWLLRLVGVLVLAGAVIATTLTLGRKENLRRVLVWIHVHTAAGFFIFALLYVWFTVLFLPSALLAAAAGAIYGVLVATPLVWVCAVLGETVSFLLGRFLLRKWVRELTADWPMWTALNAALKEDGWKLVALLRISPVIPFSILNYGLGSSSLPFSHYFWPSVFCIVPGLIIYVYLGSLAADVTEAMSDHGVQAPPAAKIAIIVSGAVSALVVVVLSAVYTKRAIDRRLSHVHVLEETQVEEQHYLLGEPGEGALAPRGILVSVESPVVVVETDRELQEGLRPSDGGGSNSGRSSSAGAGASSGGGIAGSSSVGGWLWHVLPAAFGRKRKRDARSSEEGSSSRCLVDEAERAADGGIQGPCKNGVISSSGGSSRPGRSNSLGGQQQQQQSELQVAVAAASGLSNGLGSLSSRAGSQGSQLDRLGQAGGKAW